MGTDFVPFMPATVYIYAHKNKKLTVFSDHIDTASGEYIRVV
jgi:hypothetical protein